MPATPKWKTTRYGQRMEVPSGTNPEPLLVFRILPAVFNLGLRVVLAALQDDPGFGLRAKVGAFKIEAPLEWRANRAFFVKPEELRNENGTGPYKISSARKEKLEFDPCADGSPGCYIIRANEAVSDMTIAAYKKLAEKLPALTDSVFKFDLTEENLRKNDPFPLIAARNKKLAKQGQALPIYAADQEGSLFREATPGINLLRVNNETYWKHLHEAGCLPAGGVTSPYLYFGMAGTTFATHVEDMDLCSVSYNHSGAAKVWFVVSKDYRQQVLDLADRVLSQAEKGGCHVPLRHKHVILPPTLLTANNIPFTVLIQREGDYVFTEPGSFHCGFNVGFNIAEAVNYATEEWLEEGIRVFGGYYDSEAPMNTDYGELCICDYRYSLAPNVRFTKFPAATVCKIFHRRQRMFCAMKRYTDTCVDLLRAGGHEPPSVDLITEAFKSVRITGPGAEPNPLREPLVFGSRPASNDG
ncbi:JmjC domain containing protein, partial [Aphelenchoides avenae]